MLVMTRFSARIGLRDGIHIFGINGIPRFTSTVWDTLVKSTVPRQVGLRPAVGFQLIELPTGLEGIICVNRGCTDPTKRTTNRKTGSLIRVDINDGS